MSKAEVKFGGIKEVTLRLSEREAKTLLAVLGCITGNSKYAGPVFDALRMSCEELREWDIPDGLVINENQNIAYASLDKVFDET